MTLLYLDNHATTRMDPRVLGAMLPWLDSLYANPGSTTHEAGRHARQLVDDAIESIGNHFGVTSDEVVITSGATESNNLGLFGFCMHPRQKRRKIVSLLTEHHAMLDPLNRMAKQGFHVELLPVEKHPSSNAGLVDLQMLRESVDHETAMVSIMMANNEIGVIQPMHEIAEICHAKGAILLSDASQAVGRLNTNARSLGIDLLTFSGHKLYGPKGVGGLIVNSPTNSIRIWPQIVGGGQQDNRRSGTLNSPGIIGLATALEVARERRIHDEAHAMELRAKLWNLLREGIPGVRLNGADWQSEGPNIRLSGNLNVCFPKVEGQSLMLEIPSLAVSSGSACTSANPEPSHVLMEIGRSEDEARASIRFGIGRFNTCEEITLAASLIVEAYRKLASFVA